MRELVELRSELGAIDEQLLELVKRRQQLALEIGAIKRAAGRSTRDYRQERDVLDRCRAKANQVGLAPQIAEELMVLLIRSSLTVQEKDRVAAASEGTGKRVLIIGGAGQMGQWLARFLGSQGFSIEIADPTPTPGFPQRQRWQEGELDHDFIIVAAPLKASGEILLEMAEKKPRGVVFDVGSLKSPLRAGLSACRDAGLRVTSVHPMFGPNTELLSGRHVVFVDAGCEEATAKARELFSATMAKHVEMNLESHDRLIAYVLGLSHALNIAFFTALAESGEAAPALAQLSSTTFDAQLDVAGGVAAENPQLYFEIQSLNDYGSESLSALLYAVERIRSVIRAGDANAFATLMRKGRSYLETRLADEDPPP